MQNEHFFRMAGYSAVPQEPRGSRAVSPGKCPHPPQTLSANLERRISCVAKRYGHCIKAEKTMYLDASTSKIVTGVALTPTREPKAPNALGEGTASDLSQIGRGNLSKAISCLERNNAAQMIERSLFADSKRQVEQILASA